MSSIPFTNSLTHIFQDGFCIANQIGPKDFRPLVDSSRMLQDVPDGPLLMLGVRGISGSFLGISWKFYSQMFLPITAGWFGTFSIQLGMS